MPDWIDEALRLVHDEWTKYYKPDPTVKVEDDKESHGSESPAPSQSSSTGKRRPGHLSAHAMFDVSVTSISVFRLTSEHA